MGEVPDEPALAVVVASIWPGAAAQYAIAVRGPLVLLGGPAVGQHREGRRPHSGWHLAPQVAEPLQGTALFAAIADAVLLQLRGMKASAS